MASTASHEAKLELWQRLLAAELAASKSRTLLQEFDSFRSAQPSQVRNWPGFTENERRRFDEADVQGLALWRESGVQLVTSESYPEVLAEAFGTPPALYTWGDLAAWTKPCVAIVGTRDASAYGKACASRFAEDLARAGVTVVSGGALGIDAAAHKGALKVNGATIAVLACGVDYAYPAVHAGLFRQIKDRGLLVSQFALGARPNDYKFLQRNFLIAALCQAVILIEAPAKSGSLRTANAANELGRDVFVIPGPIDQPKFFGSHHLIRDGATLVTHPDQVLESLGISPSAPKIVDPSSEIGTAILNVLSMEPISTEKIVEATGLDPSTVLSELTMLEIDGKVDRDRGGYIKTL